MANRRPKLLSKRAHDLQSRINGIAQDVEARIRPPERSGQGTDDQNRGIDAYRQSPEGQALTALWELAGLVSELAEAFEGATAAADATDDA